MERQTGELKLTMSTDLVRVLVDMLSVDWEDTRFKGVEPEVLKQEYTEFYVELLTHMVQHGD